MTIYDERWVMNGENCWSAHTIPKEIDVSQAERIYSKLYASIHKYKRFNECGCILKIGIEGFTWKDQCPECLKWFNLDHELTYVQ